MKAIVFFLAFCFAIVGCKKDAVTGTENGTVCSTKNPTDDIPWLKADIAAVSAPSTYADYYAKRAIYRQREILWIEICCPACSTVPPTAKYCDGSVAGMMGTDIRNDELSGIKELWRTHNGFCGN